MSTEAREVKQKIVNEISIPEGIEASQEEFDITIKGEKGEITKSFYHPKVRANVDSDKIVIETVSGSRKEKAMVGTFESHLKNMFYGVQNGYEYKMKVLYTHFPMTVKVQEDEVVIENFLGERSPRTARIMGDAKVNVSGEDVTVTGINREDVGQTAANIESATRLSGRDRRVFKDGVYVTKKDRRK